MLFLDVPGKELCTLLLSLTNAEQIKAVRLIYNLIQQQNLVKFVILCYYSLTVRDLRNLDEQILIYTVNSFIGKEADIVMSLTTRLATVLNDKTGKILFHDQRLTVALTRAREGIIILGSRALLERGQLWRQLLKDLDSQIDSVALNDFIKFYTSSGGL